LINLTYVSIPHDGYWISSCGWANSEIYPGASEDYIEWIAHAKPKCLEKRIYETIFQALFTGIDQGVFLNANIMRPIRPETWEYSWTDNRPFVARQVVAGMLGLLLYAGATWAVLWFVEDEVQRE
jgi:hypothetical protein